MPESPEVDALAGFLREHAVGSLITATELDEFRALKTRAHPLDELVGETVTGVRRFGKHLSLDTGGRDLVISFGRAGWARWDGDDEGAAVPDAPAIGRLHLRGGDGDHELALTDAGTWLSLGVSVVDEAHDAPAVEKLGPDPVDPVFTSSDLDAVLVGRRKQLRALLQEQESLAGIGGAYSDEILYAARLDPLMHAADLSADQRTRLFEAMRSVLTEAFAARRGVPIAQLKAAKIAAMKVHGRTGEPCPEGDGVVEDVPGTKGGGQWCPACQTV